MEGPLTVVGLGRIGRLFAKLAEAQRRPVVAVTRSENRAAVEERGGAGPIVVAAREDDLEDLVPRIHPSHAPRLVFVQNGFVGEAIAPLAGAGRGLLHFNAADEGAVRVLLLSVFGVNEAAREAGTILDRGGIPARFEEDALRFRVEEIRKCLWSVVLGILAARRGVRVGDLFAKFEGEVVALARECVAVAGKSLGVEPDLEDLLESLRTMAERLPEYPGSLRGQRYRNAFLVREGRRLGIPTPLNERLLGA